MGHLHTHDMRACPLKSPSPAGDALRQQGTFPRRQVHGTLQAPVASFSFPCPSGMSSPSGGDVRERAARAFPSFISAVAKRKSGGYSRGVPPLPIPNREVKPTRADGTAPQCGRVGRRLLHGASVRKYGCPFSFFTQLLPFSLCFLLFYFLFFIYTFFSLYSPSLPLSLSSFLFFQADSVTLRMLVHSDCQNADGLHY